MFLCLCFLLAGCLCHSLPVTHSRRVLQNTVATLRCPHRAGDVTWSRFIGGEKVTLVTIKNGLQEFTINKRYGSLSDNSLVITNVKISDSTMYTCNGKNIYLDVTTDPTMVDPNAQPGGGNVPVTPLNDRQGFGLDSDQKVNAADTEDQQSSDIWKIPVGAVIGAALVLLAILTLRFWSKKRAERNTDLNKTVTEVIYEEIDNGNTQPRKESDVECPYYWTSITETPSTSAPPADNLYTAVNKLKTKRRGDDECVYSLAQNPLQKGNDSE